MQRNLEPLDIVETNNTIQIVEILKRNCIEAGGDPKYVYLSADRYFRLKEEVKGDIKEIHGLKVRVSHFDMGFDQVLVTRDDLLIR
jgi:hypothetical protein